MKKQLKSMAIVSLVAMQIFVSTFADLGVVHAMEPAEELATSEESSAKDSSGEKKLEEGQSGASSAEIQDSNENSGQDSSSKSADGQKENGSQPGANNQNQTDGQPTDDSQNQFLMMQNSTPHNPVELQLPDYTPKQDVKNGEYTDSSLYTIDGVTAKVLEDPTPYHYHVNMASFMRLGEWFDYLRAEGVYDNTRIIIVSDHGYALGQFDYMIMDDGLDVEAVNPLLLYKDFSDTESRTDNSFMTNADVPTMAMTGLIEDMTNPFTGKTINSDEKTAHDQIVTTADNHSVRENNGKTFDTGDWDWYSVHDNIFDSSNWTNLGADNKAAE